MADWSSLLPSSRAGHLRQAIILSVILTFLGLINVTFFGWNISLSWLPLMAVALWPRAATPIYSIVALFLLGLLQDSGSFGVPGQWPLIYLLCYAFIRPFERLKSLNFLSGFLLWLLSAGIAFVVISFSGRIIYAEWPNWIILSRLALTTTLLFPLVWGGRRWLQILILRRDGA
jgi:cell shape-determining protein MreD